MYYLETTCVTTSHQAFEALTKNARAASYKNIVRIVRRYLPELFHALCLNLYNPFAEQAKQTKTHYILVHSGIEYFIKKIPK